VWTGEEMLVFGDPVDPKGVTACPRVRR